MTKPKRWYHPRWDVYTATDVLTSEQEDGLAGEGWMPVIEGPVEITGATVAGAVGDTLIWLDGSKHVCGGVADA